MTKQIQQCYQTCKDIKCPLFDMYELNCSAFKEGNCKYQTVHMIQGASDFNQSLDGKEHGLYRVLNDNGQIWLECSYVNGKGHGVNREWYENGQLSVECNYKDGKLYGLCREWYSNGQLIEESNYLDGQLHGRYREWNDNGELIEECNYKDGRKLSDDKNDGYG